MKLLMKGRINKDEPREPLPWAAVGYAGLGSGGFCLDFSFQLCLQTQATEASVPT